MTNCGHSVNSPYGRIIFALIALAIVSYPARVHATDGTADWGQSMFSFSGFGTFGLVHSSEDRADFATGPLQPSGAGYTNSWSPDVDSRLGAQVIAHFTPQLSAMLQVISEQLYDGKYTPHVEWANIAYQATPEFNVRVGRIVLPTFLFSDSRKVGYTNPWIRPPVEVYALEDIFNSDGVDASYKLHMGEVVDTLVATYGNNNHAVPQGGTSDAKHLWVIADTVEYGALTVHIAYQKASFSYVNYDILFDALRQFGPRGAALADKYDLDNKPAQVITAGAVYDPGNWFVMGEWMRRNLHSAIGESTAWYLSGGYRIAKFAPYLTYAKVRADSNTFDPGLSVSALPPYLAGPATALNAGLNAILGSAAVQHTISAGVRWDVMKNIDLKMQYDHIDLGSGSAGTLINVQPGFQRGSSVNVFSVAVDFVW